MAKKQEKSKKVSAKKPTMRELSKAEAKPSKKKRILKAKSGASSSAKKHFLKLGREYHPIKMPDNKVGRFLGKKRSIIPKYFKEAWAEVKLATWPGRKETIRLSVAVFIFSVIFGLFVAVLDFGLDKLFKEIILKV